MVERATEERAGSNAIRAPRAEKPTSRTATVPELLVELRGRGIHVRADGERLRCNAPAGELTTELRERLQERKHEILTFLRTADSLARQSGALVPLQPSGTRTPIFGVGGHNGDVFCYQSLTRHLGTDQPFYGLQPPGLDGASRPLVRIPALAAHFAAHVREFHAGGACVVAGFCAGCAVAFELARQLRHAGVEVSGVALFGAPHPSRYRRLAMLREYVWQRGERLAGHMRELAARPVAQWASYFAEWRRSRSALRGEAAAARRDPVLVRRTAVERATLAALRDYEPGRFHGRVCLFLPCEGWARSRDKPLRWRSLAARVDEYYGPDGCNNDDMLREPHAAEFAALYERAMSGV